MKFNLYSPLQIIKFSLVLIKNSKYLSKCHTATGILPMRVACAATWGRDHIKVQTMLVPEGHVTTRARPIWVAYAAVLTKLAAEDHVCIRSHANLVAWRATWTRSWADTLGHVSVARVWADVLGSRYHRELQETCLLKSEDCVQLALSLTGPRVVGPVHHWILLQEIWYHPSSSMGEFTHTTLDRWPNPSP